MRLFLKLFLFFLFINNILLYAYPVGIKTYFVKSYKLQAKSDQDLHGACTLEENWNSIFHDDRYLGEQLITYSNDSANKCTEIGAYGYTTSTLSFEESMYSGGGSSFIWEGILFNGCFYEMTVKYIFNCTEEITCPSGSIWNIDKFECIYNENKSDLYYANGIMIGETEPIAREVWKDKIEDILFNNSDTLNKIGKVDISYNVSEDLFDDLYEAFLQSGNEQGWLTFSKYIPTYYGNEIPDYVDTHRPDLVTQINAYKESIKLGHGIIVVAHSQGNYYTNEAYEELDEWMKPYFHMFGVATPADHVAGFAVGDITAPYVTFHNDLINVVLTGLASNRDDPNTNHSSLLSYDAHDFYDSYMTADNTKNEIQSFIINRINEHKETPSQ